jgi:hypothetical protein
MGHVASSLERLAYRRTPSADSARSLIARPFVVDG